MFTKQELDFLIECVDSRPRAGDAGALMGDIMMTMMIKDEDALKKLKEDLAKEGRKRERERKVIEERCVLLKAKIIQIRDSIDADELLNAQ